MRKITTGLFTSLDGIAAPDGDWQFPYFDEELFTGIAAGWSDGTIIWATPSGHTYQVDPPPVTEPCVRAGSNDALDGPPPF